MSGSELVPGPVDRPDARGRGRVRIAPIAGAFGEHVAEPADARLRGSHSGVSSLCSSALANAVAFSMACSRVKVLGLKRRETRLSQ